MRMHSPSLTELHAFVVAARLGSFSAAAQQLCVTQGGISRAVARLEAHLGTPLFVRQGRSNTLTPGGQSYLADVQAAVDQIERATHRVRTRPEPNRLRLSVSPTLLSHWLIPRLPEFRLKHPQVQIQFVPYRVNDPMDDPQVDAWLRSGDGQHWPPRIVSQYILGKELVVVCLPADLQGPDAIRSGADLLKRPLLFHTLYPDNWAYWFAATHCPHGPLTPAADFERVALLLQAVMAGMGVAVVQACLVESDLAAGRLALALPQQVSLPRGYHLCHPAHQADLPSLVAFRQWLLSHACATPPGCPVPPPAGCR